MSGREGRSSIAEHVVSELARALDADDFVTARGCLAEDCVYEAARETLAGAEAAIASYAAASAWARRAFDDVRYESALGPVVDDTVPVTFTDYLMKAGARWHRHRCRQEFTVGRGGRIVRIVHHELPGEREALETYLAECGIER